MGVKWYVWLCPFSLGRICLNTASCLGRKELRLHYPQLLIYAYFSVKLCWCFRVLYFSRKCSTSFTDSSIGEFMTPCHYGYCRLVGFAVSF